MLVEWQAAITPGIERVIQHWYNATLSSALEKWKRHRQHAVAAKRQAAEAAAEAAAAAGKARRKANAAAAEAQRKVDAAAAEVQRKADVETALSTPGRSPRQSIDRSTRSHILALAARWHQRVSERMQYSLAEVHGRQRAWTDLQGLARSPNRLQLPVDLARCHIFFQEWAGQTVKAKRQQLARVMATIHWSSWTLAR